MNEAEILFFDNHLLVLNKPAGMLTQPNESAELSLEQFGKQWVKRRFAKPGDVFLEAVHRIDKPASGIVLFARTSKALSRLQASLREGLFQKEYLALVEGSLELQQQELEHYLVHESFHARVASPKEEGAKRSILKYRALKKVGVYTLLKIALKTGRYHQIRAQLSAIGHPIAGDRKYGSKSVFPSFGLHHCRLEVPHPILKTPCVWTAPIPISWPYSIRI